MMVKPSGGGVPHGPAAVHTPAPRMAARRDVRHKGKDFCLNITSDSRFSPCRGAFFACAIPSGAQPDREMLTRNRAIWFSPKNVLSLHCIGADRRLTRACSGVFAYAMVARQVPEGPRRQHLEKTTKHLGKTTKPAVPSTRRIVVRRWDFHGANLSRNCCQRLYMLM